MDPQAIKSELEQAERHDKLAREHRQRAGDILRRTAGWVDVHKTAQALGMDTRKVELLLQMAPVKPRTATPANPRPETAPKF